MKRVERDFITLFNCLWYRDFPVSETHALAGRTDWTIHLGLVVRQCATLLGARALFEQGGRTDAVIRYSDTDNQERYQRLVGGLPALADLFDRDLEIGNSAVADEGLKHCGISLVEQLGELIDFGVSPRPLPLYERKRTYEISGRKRHFKELQTYMFAKGKYRKIRSQPALPWEVNRAKANNESEDAS